MAEKLSHDNRWPTAEMRRVFVSKERNDCIGVMMRGGEEGWQSASWDLETLLHEDEDDK